jgi:ubiquinone biosynthesis monooxygenase Coq7
VLTRDPKAREAVRTIREMEAQERAHLEIFDDLVRKRQVRPTALTPFWHAAGYALGAGTALLGEKAAMACTAAVEEVIESHYAAQAERLGDADPALRGTIEKCRDEEITHRDEALVQGAEQAPFYPLLSSAIKFGCRVAIALSEKI